MKPPIVTLRFALYGCKNRPFFFIVATNRKRPRNYGYLEQVRNTYIHSYNLLLYMLLYVKVQDQTRVLTEQKSIYQFI